MSRLAILALIATLANEGATCADPAPASKGAATAPAAAQAEGDAPILARPSGWIFLGPDDGSEPRVWSGAPISLSLKDADLREVLRGLAQIGGFNLILDPAVRGEVTLELEQVPWDQVLYVLLRTHDLGAEVDGTIVTVERQPG